MRVLMIAGLLIAVSTSAAAVAQVSAPKTVVSLTPADPGEKIVCKRSKDRDTGSNLKRSGKTCMTANAWRDLETLNDEAKRRIHDRSAMGQNVPAIEVGLGGGD